MAGLKAGNGAAKALIRLRVILAGEGVVRDERGVFRATLPGAGHMVDIDDRAGTAQMLYRSGGPMSTKMDLSNEPEFASFMHNVDSCMASAGRLPMCLLSLADEYARAAAEGDQSLGSIISDANIELPVGEGKWAPSPAFRGLAEAARWTKDKELSDVAEDAARFVSEKIKVLPTFSTTDSQSKWLDLIERWASKGSVSYELDTGTWTHIKTRSGLTSASKRVGHDMASILTGDAGFRLSFDKVDVYAFHDQDGDIQAVGVVHDDILVMHTASSAGALDEEAEELRFQTCAPPSPRP